MLYYRGFPPAASETPTAHATGAYRARVELGQPINASSSESDHFSGTVLFLEAAPRPRQVGAIRLHSPVLRFRLHLRCLLTNGLFLLVQQVQAGYFLFSA